MKKFDNNEEDKTYISHQTVHLLSYFVKNITLIRIKRFVKKTKLHNNGIF